jgi:phosphoglycerol transferase MdoB-like AlkP superfamily enzyme|tara:strand:+ start:1731 stop:3509 length:1779 start_codon:yes stop_codon:yes gene_type:complete
MINIIILRFVVLPVTLWVFLSLPGLYYAVNYLDLWEVFDTAYVNLNFNFVAIILGVFAPIYYLSKKTSRIVFPLILSLLFLIRFFDIGLKSTFEISFSPIVFRSTSFDSFLIALNLFGKELVLITLVGVLCSIVISYLMGFSFHKSKTSIITIVLFLLLAVRSTYIIYNERYYAFEKIPSYLLAKELLEFQDSLKQKRIKLSDVEAQNLNKIGIGPQSPGLSKLKNYVQKRNVVILYLESFNTNYTKKGGSHFKDLTPNIDLFIEESVLFSNYFNAVSPTHNSIFSSWCGIFPELHDNYVRENPDYTKSLTCFSDILNSLGYTQKFFFGHGSWYAGITLFLKNHSYEQVTELSHIEREFPAMVKNKHIWGIQDTDLSRYVIRQVEQVENNQPFNIGAFYINTHPPFFTAPDCPKYVLDNTSKLHLQSIHCVDHAVGMILQTLKKRGLMGNTVVVVVGDTPGHDHEKGQFLSYNRTLLAVYSPNLKPGINKTVSYSPDLGPTILEAMGIPVPQIQSGHSILTSRLDFPNLVAPEFSVVDGEYRNGGRCSFEEMGMQKIGIILDDVTDCERRKIFQYLSQWIKLKDSNRTLTMD